MSRSAIASNNRKILIMVAAMVALISTIYLLSVGAVTSGPIDSRTQEATLLVVRVASFSEGDYVTLSEAIVSRHPVILTALDEADKKYEAALASTFRCDNDPDCMGPPPPRKTVIVNMTQEEARAGIASLGLHDFPAHALDHGIHAKYNGKYYGIVIKGV